MPLFNNVVDALVASREWDQATLTRLAYWSEVFWEREVTAISPDEVDAAMVKLAERGRLKGGKHETVTTGKPLAGPTLNRYLSQLGSVFKYARRMRLVPRTFLSPTRGIEREPERVDPERYLRPEQVERIVGLARVLDRRWGKMAALITLAHHTGLRVGDLMKVRGKDVDLAECTVTVYITKNRRPARRRPGSSTRGVETACPRLHPTNSSSATALASRLPTNRCGRRSPARRACPAACSMSYATVTATCSRAQA